MAILYCMKSHEKSITTRYPVDLYNAIKQRAEEGGRSFNAEVVYELRQYQAKQSQPKSLATVPGVNAEDLQTTGELTIEQAWKRYSL
jgi:hypothetical protein